MEKKTSDAITSRGARCPPFHVCVISRCPPQPHAVYSICITPPPFSSFACSPHIKVYSLGSRNGHYPTLVMSRPVRKNDAFRSPLKEAPLGSIESGITSLFLILEKGGARFS